jgi:hypothetical protein
MLAEDIITAGENPPSAVTMIPAIIISNLKTFETNTT